MVHSEPLITITVRVLTRANKKLKWASGKAGNRNPESGIGTGKATGTETGSEREKKPIQKRGQHLP